MRSNPLCAPSAPPVTTPLSTENTRKDLKLTNSDNKNKNNNNNKLTYMYKHETRRTRA